LWDSARGKELPLPDALLLVLDRLSSSLESTMHERRRRGGEGGREEGREEGDEGEE